MPTVHLPRDCYAADLIQALGDAGVMSRGLPEGELFHEAAHPETGEALAILDLAWPRGLQEGLSQPVALLIDEGAATLHAANTAGFRYFTSVDAFQRYVEQEILALETAEAS